MFGYPIRLVSGFQCQSRAPNTPVPTACPSACSQTVLRIMRASGLPHRRVPHGVVTTAPAARLALAEPGPAPVASQPLTRLHHSRRPVLKKPWPGRDCRSCCGSGWTLFQDRSASSRSAQGCPCVSSPSGVERGAAGQAPRLRRVVPGRDTYWFSLFLCLVSGPEAP